MKKFLLVILSAVFAVGTSFAQTDYSAYERDNAGRDFDSRYLNIGFAWQGAYEPAGDMEIKIDGSDWGVGLTKGRSYILHQRPIGGVVRFGFDATWFDFNIAHFKNETWTQSWQQSHVVTNAYQIDFALGFGPSIHITPVNHKFSLHTYARYNPTLSVITSNTKNTVEENKDVMGGYSSTIVFGGAVSWDSFSIGIEGRWGLGSYNDLRGPKEERTYGTDIRTKGCRAYIGFRF